MTLFYLPKYLDLVVVAQEKLSIKTPLHGTQFLFIHSCFIYHCLRIIPGGYISSLETLLVTHSSAKVETSS